MGADLPFDRGIFQRAIISWIISWVVMSCMSNLALHLILRLQSTYGRSAPNRKNFTPDLKPFNLAHWVWSPSRKNCLDFFLLFFWFNTITLNTTLSFCSGHYPIPSSLRRPTWGKLIITATERTKLDRSSGLNKNKASCSTSVCWLNAWMYYNYN